MKQNFSFLKKKSFFLIFVCFFSFFACFHLTNAQSAVWTEPSCDPPGCNIELPLNQGSTPQTKIGALTVGGLTVNGAMTFNGLLTVTNGLALTNTQATISGTILNFTSSPITIQNTTPSATLITLAIGGEDFKGIFAEDKSDSVTSIGVRAITNRGYGIYGSAISSVGIAIAGSSATGLAGRFDGEVRFNKNGDVSTMATIKDGVIQASSLVKTGSLPNNRCLYADQNGIIKSDIASCGGSGSLPIGTNGDTLRYNNGWLANSVLYNNGTNIGIGTSAPSAKLHIISATETNSEQLRLGYDNSHYASFVVDGDHNLTIDTSNTGKLKFNDDIVLNRLVNCSTTKALTTNTSGQIICGTVSGSGGTLAGGQQYYIPLWTGTGTLGTSTLFQDPVTKNIGISAIDSRPVARLDIQGGGSSAPATSGTNQSSGLITRLHDSTNLVMDIGGNGGSGIWFQSTDKSNLSSNYPILLNPNGGSVGIGTTAPLASAKLDINGDTQIRGSLYVEGSGNVFADSLSVGNQLDVVGDNAKICVNGNCRTNLKLQCPPKRIMIETEGVNEMNSYLRYSVCTSFSSSSIGEYSEYVILDNPQYCYYLNSQRWCYGIIAPPAGNACKDFCQEFGFNGDSVNSGTHYVVGQLHFYYHDGFWDSLDGPPYNVDEATSCKCFM